MKYIDGSAVKELLRMSNCIELMKHTLIELSEGRAKQVLRMVMPLGESSFLGLMPSAISSKQIAGAKVISIFPQNSTRDLPSHQGVVLLFETETGELKAIVDGEEITAIRTSAVSAAATELLARNDSETLAVIGAGVQARYHLEAMLCVRDIKRVNVWDIDYNFASRYAKEMTEKHGLTVTVCKSSTEAIKDADIICAVSAAAEPVVYGKDIKDGAHINAVGACRANVRELDTEAVIKGRMYADSMESLMNEAGDFLIPYREGLVSEDVITGELGRALSGKIDGRRNDSEITIFQSLGLGVYDIAAADFVLKASESNG